MTRWRQCGDDWIVYSYIGSEDGKPHLWKVPAAGGEATQLTSASYDVVTDCSPDAETVMIASLAPEENFNLFTVSIDGGEATRITPRDPSWETGGRWSPDGSQIVFRSNVEGNYELYRMPASGGEATRLTESSSSESAASWSPDGTTLVYSLNVGDSDIWTMDVGDAGSPTSTDD